MPGGQKSFNCPDCNKNIPGTNCAFALSRAKVWKNKPGCHAECTCGYPVRTLDLRNHVFTGFLDRDKTSTVPAYIYCESGGDRHVYYGTYDKCEVGNGLSASGMMPCTVFERYSSAK